MKTEIFKNQSIMFVIMVIVGMLFNPMNILAYRFSDLYISQTLFYGGLLMASNMMFTPSQSPLPMTRQNGCPRTNPMGPNLMRPTRQTIPLLSVQVLGNTYVPILILKRDDRLTTSKL